MTATSQQAHLAPPPSAYHSVVGDGEAFIWEPHPGIVVQQASGVLSLPLAHCFGDFYRPLLQPGVRVRVFDDFEQLTYYTREAREYLTELTLELLPAVEVIHFLIASKFMALGIGAFKHDIGDKRVHVYTDRTSFLQSYEHAVQQG